LSRGLRSGPPEEAINGTDPPKDRKGVQFVFQVCPFCGDADDVSRQRLGPGAWHYECRNVKKHPGTSRYEWDGTDDSVIKSDEHGGLAAELGLHTDLLSCIRPGEPWVEYGVVEHRYSEVNPENYKKLIDRFGHTRIASKAYTASVYISLTLGRMIKTGEVSWQSGRGTGYWRYNSDISYWALPPEPPTEDRITYEEYATSIGLDPMA
jgi:hypothetical protein